MCVFFLCPEGKGAPMTNKEFSQLTAAERLEKFDTIIRSRTNNLLNARQIKTLANGIRFNRQYIIAVHPANRKNCEVLVYKNILRIYIPRHLIKVKAGGCEICV